MFLKLSEDVLNSFANLKYYLVVFALGMFDEKGFVFCPSTLHLWKYYWPNVLQCTLTKKTICQIENLPQM